MNDDLSLLSEEVTEALKWMDRRGPDLAWNILRVELLRLTRENAESKARIEYATTWIEETSHGENCYLSSHYDGDPGDQCNCGKESVLARLEEADLDQPWIGQIEERAERAETELRLSQFDYISLRERLDRAESELTKLRARIEASHLVLADGHGDVMFPMGQVMFDQPKGKRVRLLVEDGE